MQLYEIFKPKYIKRHLKSVEKDEVFEELTGFLTEVYRINFHDEILNALRTREQKMSTGIKNGIAIPHGKIEQINDIFGVLGISDKGIEYDSLDGKPVHLIFLFISSYSKHQNHLDLLSNIGKLLESNQILKNILNTKSSEEVNLLLKSPRSA